MGHTLVRPESDLEPRLLTLNELARYLGYANSTSIANLVKDGSIPPPIFGKKWDRRAVDLAIDKLSGLGPGTH